MSYCGEPLNDREVRLMIKKIGTAFFELRSYTPIPLILLAVYFAQLSWILTIVGVLVLLIGELMRIWAVGYAGR